jgi:FkbM family methyltransferase
MRRAYQIAADACAELVWRVPGLERPFVSCGARVWQAPGVGRFYRSAAFRLADRLRTTHSAFRPVTIRGHRIILDVAEFTATSPYFGGPVYEQETTDYIVQHLHAGHVFVDIGANHGYFTLLAASLVGESGHVTAFEPHPGVFAQLQTHVRLNGFEARTTLQPCALADAPGDAARLYVSRDAVNSGLSSLTPSEAQFAAGGLSPEATVTVAVDTFDRWCTAHRPARLDLVKIDVEGAEAAVVAGMEQTLRTGRIHALIVETAWNGPAHQRLARAGYDARPLDAVGPLTNVLFTRRSDAHRH